MRRTDAACNWSRFGVFSNGFPWAETSPYPWSSVMIKITLGFSSHKSTHWVVMYFSIMVNEHLLQIFLLSLFFQVFCVWVLMKRRRNYDEYRKKSSTAFLFVAVELYQHLQQNLFYQNNNVVFFSIFPFLYMLHLSFVKGKISEQKLEKYW